jgi:hypothetical protein
LKTQIAITQENKDLREMGNSGQHIAKIIIMQSLNLKLELYIIFESKTEKKKMHKNCPEKKFPHFTFC